MSNNQANQHNSLSKESSSDLSSLYESKLALLDKLISDIDQQVSKRKLMQELFSREISDLISEVNTQIEHFKFQENPTWVSFTSRMQIFCFELELRKKEEGMRAWSDVQVLLRERREVEREKMEIERRLKAVGEDAEGR